MASETRPVTSTPTSEPTLGRIYNAISALCADKKYRPDLPITAVLSPEEIHALHLATAPADRGDGTSGGR